MRTRSISQLRSMGWPALATTCASFALACAAIVYWSMQLAAPRVPIAPSSVVLENRAPPDLSLASKLFGVTPAESAAQAAPSNIKVLGIIAAGPRGSALLVVDDKPVRAFGLGEEITPGRKIAAVTRDSVVIDFNGVRSELASPARASLEVLTSGVGKERAPSEAPPAPAAAAPGAVPANAQAALPGTSPEAAQPALIPGLPAGGLPGLPPAPPRAAAAPPLPPAGAAAAPPSGPDFAARRARRSRSNDE